MNAEPVAGRRFGRRAMCAAAMVAVAFTSGCAAGQLAQTADQKPTIDGTESAIGDIKLRGLSIAAPSANFYPAGASARIRVVIVNSGTRADRLTSISSSGFSGWSAYATSIGAAAGVGGSQSVTVQSGSRAGFGVPDSRQVLVVSGLTRRLFPGGNMRLTFQFARAGTGSVTVPVQLSDSPGTSVVPEPSANNEPG